MSQLYFLTPTPVGQFRGVDLTARAAFGLIYDRWKLSCKRSKEHPGEWKDESGVYCVYDQRDLGEVLGVTLPTIRSALVRLEKRKLITTRKPSIGSPIRYYIPDYVDQYFYDNEGWLLGIEPQNEP